jgi:hypothetical protein
MLLIQIDHLEWRALAVDPNSLLHADINNPCARLNAMSLTMKTMITSLAMPLVLGQTSFQFLDPPNQFINYP